MAEKVYGNREILGENHGSILVLTGPSGAGKDTVMQGLLEDDTLGFERIVTYTSRPRRPQETDGVDYHFVTRGEFEAMIEMGQFAEHVEYRGDYKGTPVEPFQQTLTGKKLIWRIDPTRAATVHSFYEGQFDVETAQILSMCTHTMYVGVSRLMMLYDRVRVRSGDLFPPQKAAFQRQLERDWNEWNAYQDSFDTVLLNDGTIEETVKMAREIIINSGYVRLFEVK